MMIMKIMIKMMMTKITTIMMNIQMNKNMMKMKRTIVIIGIMKNKMRNNLMKMKITIIEVMGIIIKYKMNKLMIMMKLNAKVKT